jgi:hypothetical protein
MTVGGLIGLLIGLLFGLVIGRADRIGEGGKGSGSRP